MIPYYVLHYPPLFPDPTSSCPNSRYIICLPSRIFWSLASIFSQAGSFALSSSCNPRFSVFVRLTILNMNLNSCMIIIWLSSVRICEPSVELGTRQKLGDGGRYHVIGVAAKWLESGKVSTYYTNDSYRPGYMH